MSDVNDNQTGLGTRVAIGAAWLLAMRWGIRFLGLISTLVLARLLSPVDFGIVAMASASIAIAEGLTAMPMGQALIRLKDADRSFYDTAWTLNVLRGAAVALVLLAVAWPVATWMDEPRLTPVLMVLAAGILIEGFRNPRFIDFEKHLKFAAITYVQVGTKIIGVAVTIGFAIYLQSYWALVIGTLVSTVIRMALTYAFLRYLPRFSLCRTRALFGFSAWLSGASIVNTLNVQLDKFVVAGYLTTAWVGIYHMGMEIARLSTQDVVPPLRRALFPSFAMISDDRDKLRRNALEAGAILGAVTIPMGFGLALVAHEFVVVVLTEKWLSIVPLVVLMSPLVSIHAIVAVADPVVMVRASTRLLFNRTLLVFTVKFASLFVGLHYFGFTGLLYSLALGNLTYLFVQLLLLRKVLGVSILTPLVASWRSFVGAGFMAAAIFAIDGSATAEMSVELLLAIKVVVGAAVYPVVHVLCWHIGGRPAGIERRMIGFWPQIRALYFKGSQP